MNTDLLKYKLLQLAFSGQLSTKNNEDMDISKVLEFIQSKHQELIDNKTIKKEKKISEIILDEEKPFNIPNNWEWSRLYFCLDVRDGTHDSPKYVTDGIPFVTSKNLNNGAIDYSNITYISQNDADKINMRSNVDDGDILFAMIGSIGNPVIVKKTFEFCIKNVALFKNPNKNVLLNKYIYYYLYLSQLRMKKESTGGLQPFVPLNYLRNYPIPITSPEEQQRIVEKLDSIFVLLDQLEIRKANLYSLKQKLQKKVINMYISGECEEDFEQDKWGEDELGNLLIYEQPTKYLVKNEKYSNEYKSPVLTAGKTFILGYTNEKEGIFNNLPVIIFDDFTTASKYVDFPFKAKSSAMKILNCNPEMNIKYYYYYLQSLNYDSSTHKRYWISEFAPMIVPVPSKNQQDRIVDRIEQLLNLIEQI